MNFWIYSGNWVNNETKSFKRTLNKFRSIKNILSWWLQHLTIWKQFRLLYNWSFLLDKLKSTLTTVCWRLMIILVRYRGSKLKLLSYCLSRFSQSQSHQLISAFKGVEVDEPSKNIESVLVNICSEIGSWTKNCLVFNLQLWPTTSPQIKSP